MSTTTDAEQVMLSAYVVEQLRTDVAEYDRLQHLLAQATDRGDLAEARLLDRQRAICSGGIVGLLRHPLDTSGRSA